MPRTTAKSELITARLRLRWMTEDDAALALAVWNDPDFISHVGDRGIRTLSEARQALHDGLLKLYTEFGYGPYLVEALEGGPPMGLCGLFKREYLEVPDIGYGFLPEYRGRGYALEAASAVVAHARDHLRLPQLKAIVSVANERSVRLLERLGMRAEGTLQKPDESDDVTVYVIEFSPVLQPRD